MSSDTAKLVLAFLDSMDGEKLSGKVILDVGCGFGTWHLIRVLVDQGGTRAYLVGCDVFRPYLKKVKKYNPYDDLVLCDVRFVPFRFSCADTVLVFEVLEHVEKEEGLNVLVNLEQLSKKNVIVTTPLGFYKQDKGRGNVFETHRSAWYEKDFARLGYVTRTYGAGIELEKLCRRSFLFSILHRLRRFFAGNRWSGLLILAEKHVSAREQPNRS